MCGTHHNGSFPIIIASFWGLGFVKVYILVLVWGKCYFVKVTFPAVLQSDKFMHGFWTLLCRELQVTNTNSPWDQAKKMTSAPATQGKVRQRGSYLLIQCFSRSVMLRQWPRSQNKRTCFIFSPVISFILNRMMRILVRFFILLNFSWCFHSKAPSAGVARMWKMLHSSPNLRCQLSRGILSERECVRSNAQKRVFYLFPTVTENPWSMECVLSTRQSSFFTHSG